MITDSEYRKIGVGVFKVGVVAFAIGVLTGYLFFN
jgi:hypothetical protein